MGGERSTLAPQSSRQISIGNSIGKARGIDKWRKLVSVDLIAIRVKLVMINCTAFMVATSQQLLSENRRHSNKAE